MIILAFIFWLPIVLFAILVAKWLGLHGRRLFWATLAAAAVLPMIYFFVRPASGDPDVVLGVFLIPFVAYVAATLVWTIALGAVWVAKRLSAGSRS